VLRVRVRDLVNVFKQKGEGDIGMSWSTPSTGSRIMPSGDGGWYWEVINLKEVIARGVADTEPDACEQAGDAARKAGLIEQEKPPGMCRAAKSFIPRGDPHMQGG
jgi:hypothetical protein